MPLLSPKSMIMFEGPYVKVLNIQMFQLLLVLSMKKATGILSLLEMIFLNEAAVVANPHPH